MRAAIIGPGRLGTLLATALARAGHPPVAVAGGQPEARQRLAGLVAGLRPVDELAEAAARAQLLVCTVPDDAVRALADRLAAEDLVGEGHRVVHCAGSLGLDALRRCGLAGAGVAACHPAMTVPAGTTDPDALVGVAWAVTAPEADRRWAHGLVADLGGDPQDVDEAARVRYHAGLTVGSNAVGAAVALARQLLLSTGVPRPEAFLGPLVRASVDNVLARGASAITGPVVRGDAGTVARHVEALADDAPALAEGYRHLGRAVLAQVAPELSPEARAELARALGDDPTAQPGADRDPGGAR